MANNLTVSLLLVGIFIAFVVLTFLKKGRMPMKYAIVWLIPSIAIIMLALVPELFSELAKLFSFQTVSNLIIGFFFVLLFFVIMSLTIIVSGQSTKINLLIQEVSMLKKRVRDLENE